MDRSIIGKCLLISSLFILILVNTRAVTAEDVVFYGANAYDHTEMVEINLSQISAETVGETLFETQAIDQDPETGYVYYFEWQDTGDLFAYWDPVTATNTIVRAYAQSPGIYAKHMAFSPEGILFILTNQDELYIIDKDSGDLTKTGEIVGLETGAWSRTGDMTFSPEGTLYILTYESLYVVDRDTLVATLLYTDMIEVDGETVWTGAAYCGGMIYGSDVEFAEGISWIFQINPLTGEVIRLFNTQHYLNDLSSCAVNFTPPDNYPPVLSPIGDKTIDEGGSLTFTVSGSDPDGDTLTYNAENLPAGASFDPLTREFNWETTTGDAGDYSVLFSVADDGIPSKSDTEEIFISVSSPYQPVTVELSGTSTVEDTMIAGGSYSLHNLGGAENFLEVGAYGISVRSLIKWDLSEIPNGSTIISAEISLYCYQDYTGGQITIDAYRMLTDWVEGTLIDQDRSLDDPDSACWTEYGYGQPWAQNGAGGETDRDPIIESSVTGSGTGWYTWDITNAAQDWVDGYLDNNGLILQSRNEAVDNLKVFAPSEYLNQNYIPTLVVEYIAPSENNPPAIGPIGDKSVNEGEVLTFTVSGSDPDGDSLTYSAENLPAGASFDSNIGEFNWTPGYDQAGAYANILFTVTDGGTPSLSDSEPVTISVGDVNRVPVLNSIGDKSVNEGDVLIFTVSGSDPDGDFLTYNAENLPAGASFDPLSREFNWETTTGDAGDYSVLFRLTDDGTPSLGVSESVTITVGNVNRPPVLNSIGDKIVDEGGLLAFTVSGSDPGRGFPDI